MQYSNLVFILFFVACTTESRLVNLDLKSWQEDTMGCQSARLELIDDLMNRKAELTGLGQEEVSDLLGKPDRHELYSRNKKSFTYFLSDGPDCPEAMANPPKLVIRFDGLGRSKDIIYYKLNEE